MTPCCTGYCSGIGEFPRPHGSQAVGTLLTCSLAHHTLVCSLPVYTFSGPPWESSLPDIGAGAPSALLCFYFFPWSYLLPVFEDLLRLLIYFGSFCFYSSLCYYFIRLKISFLSFQWALEGKVGVDVSVCVWWGVVSTPFKFPSYFFTLSYFLCVQKWTF